MSRNSPGSRISAPFRRACSSGGIDLSPRARSRERLTLMPCGRFLYLAVVWEPPVPAPFQLAAELPQAERACRLSVVTSTSDITVTLNVAKGHNRTHAPKKASGRAFPAVSFVYLSVERPFNKFYGINCRLKLGAKLLYRFFHRRRQVSPTVNNLTHRFFNSSQHSLYCNFTVGSRHCTTAPSSSR
jgi:hypothetical protein